MKELEKLIKDGFRIGFYDDPMYQIYQVFNCFRFPNGDHIILLIENDDDKWIIHDNAQTLFELNILTVSQFDRYAERIFDIIEEYDIEIEDGVFFKEFNQSDDFYHFIQGILEIITLITYLKNE